MADPLYRCRAVSMVHAWVLDALFGPVPFVFSVSSLLLHWINCLLVAALGSWRLIGWRVSLPAAAFFAVLEGPQEAVIWFAASPELHVFAFLLGALLCWIHHRTAACVLCFVFALLSKESGVVLPALLAIALIAERDFRLRRWAAILGLGLLAAAYFAAGYIHRGNHLHYNDGTFSIHAPFWMTLLHTIARMGWIWGVASVTLIRDWRAPALALGWMVVALLPYSFLTYMSRVPSRHTYLATAGLSLLVGYAAVLLWQTRPRVAVAVAAIALVGNTAYLWTRKHGQYLERARSTEELRRQLSTGDGESPVSLCGFPYSQSIAESVVVLAGSRPERLQPASSAQCPSD
jgi:hypothetical protein